MTKRLLAVAVPALVALLAACGVSRDVTALSSGQASCTGCHGDPSRPGSPLLQAAPPVSPDGGNGGAHLAHLQRGVACGACHPVPTSQRHSNGTVDVIFSGVAVANGAAPAFSGGRDGTCSGVYCHGATLNAGGRIPAPAWSGGPLACDACHGAPPPNHAPGSTQCNACHPGTVKPDGTIDVAGGLHADGIVEVAGGHPAGWADPTQHGYAAKTGLDGCRSCHGSNLDGVGGTGPSCAGCHTAAGYASWQSNCTFCHGEKLTTYTAANLVQAAPPKGTRGETLTSARAVGAHQQHLSGGTLGPAVACTECHAVPADLSHLDGSATVTFGPTATAQGANPVWNGATCAATYCHGGTLPGGSNTAPTWTAGSTQTTCGSCHGVPPPAPHTASTACGTCHDGYSATSVNLALHMNGRVDATSPHPAGWAAKDQHGYAATRGGLAACEACHGANLDGVGGSGPSCTACHASNGFAGWATSCTFCHGDRGTGVASPPVDRQGQTATSQVSVGAHAAHVGATLTAPIACSACHPDRTGSNVITDATHVDGGLAPVTFGALATTGGAPASYTRASATSASCASVYCHGAFGGGANATMSWTSTVALSCTSCHGLPPSTGQHGEHSGRSCGDCHPGYTRTSVNPATHVDGSKEVGNYVTSWDPSTRRCVGCHGAATW